MIYCLCDRIWKICQVPEEREAELKKLKVTLAKNEYSDAVIEKEIKKFTQNRTQTNAANTQPQLQPYSNKRVDEFANKLTNLVNNTFEKVELRVAFKAPNEIGKMFPFKDNIKDKRLQLHVVYHIKCETCNKSYIGMTDRILLRRIKKHNNKKKESAIQMHLKDFPTHKIDANNIEVIDKADTTTKLKLKKCFISINGNQS